MKRTLILTGDVNLMNVQDAAVPFARVTDVLREADVLFGNLECCFYEPADGHSLENEGFYAPLASAQALRIAGFSAIGNANNVNYGAEAIGSSMRRLAEVGIPCTGAGANRATARAPARITHDGLRFGFLQRTSVYWPNGQEATDRSPGVAVIKGHTAYQPMLHKLRPDIPPANRPGVPPAILTWADAKSLAEFKDDVAALRPQVDFVVCSQHWGLFDEVLDYQVEIAHAAIDTGADIVIGHGPHVTCGIEVYRGKPIFYGLGNFSFHTGHGGKKHGDWFGLLVRATLDEAAIERVAFSLVRHNERNETYLCDPQQEREAVEQMRRRCERFGTRLQSEGDQIVVSARA